MATKNIFDVLSDDQPAPATQTKPVTAAKTDAPKTGSAKTAPKSANQPVGGQKQTASTQTSSNNKSQDVAQTGARGGYKGASGSPQQPPRLRKDFDGNRGSRRGGRGGRGGGERGGRGGKRSYDRHESGTGERRGAVKKEGGAGHNWGDKRVSNDEYDAFTDSKDENNAEGFEDTGAAATDATPAKEGDAPKEGGDAPKPEETPKEPEPTQLGFDDFVKQREAKQKALLEKLGNKSVEVRKVDEKAFANLKALPAKAEELYEGEEDEEEGEEGADASGNQASGRGKSVPIQQVFKVVDNHERRGGRGGRGGRGRGGRGGGGRGGRGARGGQGGDARRKQGAPRGGGRGYDAVADTSSFPALATTTKA